jgi:hypothetical protein
MNKYKTISVASDLSCTNLGPLYTLANGHDRETVRDLKIHPKAEQGEMWLYVWSRAFKCRIRT